MPGLGLSLRLAPALQQRVYQRHEALIKLEHKQKLQLKQLLEIKLVHPRFPNAARGIQGMIEADELLRERESAGMLIGGLSEAVWNYQRTHEELAAHKDVDVLVLNDDFFLAEPFERGIDWWLPERRRVTIREDYSSYDRGVRSFHNGNGVVLNFGIADDAWPYERSTPRLYRLSPGLHLPTRYWVKEMRIAEVVGAVEKNVEIEPRVYEAFGQLVDRRMGFRLPPYLDRVYERGVVAGSLDVERFDRPLIRAINR